MTEVHQPPPAPVNDGKTAAIVSYITLIGWIIALVIHNGEKRSLSAFHLRQSGILILANFALSMLYYILIFAHMGGIASAITSIAFIGLFILWIMGIIAAINGQEKRIPILGDLGQKVFAGIQ